MGTRHISGRQKRPTDLTNVSEHICYQCLTKACCSGWCSDFFRWLEDLQNRHGTLDDDTLVDYVVKYSRNESWTKKESSFLARKNV